MLFRVLFLSKTFISCQFVLIFVLNFRFMSFHFKTISNFMLTRTENIPGDRLVGGGFCLLLLLLMLLFPLLLLSLLRCSCCCCCCCLLFHVHFPSSNFGFFSFSFNVSLTVFSSLVCFVASKGNANAAVSGNANAAGSTCPALRRFCFARQILLFIVTRTIATIIATTATTNNNHQQQQQRQHQQEDSQRKFQRQREQQQPHCDRPMIKVPKRERASIAKLDFSKLAPKTKGQGGPWPEFAGICNKDKLVCIYLM